MTMVTVELAWDSGPYALFSLSDKEPNSEAIPPRVAMPKDLWDRYEAAWFSVSKLEAEVMEYRRSAIAP